MRSDERVRLGRDYYVRIAGNDYSVDPRMIGRFVDVHADLNTVRVSCGGRPVATHLRCWSTHQTVTDPAHVATAAELRTAFKTRTAALRGPAAHPRTATAAAGPVAGTAVGAVVAVRALTDYDDLFALTPPQLGRRLGRRVWMSCDE